MASQVSKLGPLEVGGGGDVTIVPQPFPFPPRHTPILAANGYITCQQPTGSLKTVRV
jgi:hypothetical protein